MKTDRRSAIKRRLREIKRDPTSATPGEAQRLAAEYRRLQSADRVPERAAEPESADPEAEALATWPPELLARLNQSAMARMIDRSTLGDPDGWGVKNDLRRSR